MRRIIISHNFSFQKVVVPLKFFLVAGSIYLDYMGIPQKFCLVVGSLYLENCDVIERHNISLLFFPECMQPIDFSLGLLLLACKLEYACKHMWCIN